MKYKIPRSPLSTGLSGSAKEIEGRLWNILQGKHRRPAIVLMASVIFLTAVSGMLVFCYPSQAAGLPGELAEDIFVRYYLETDGQPVYLPKNQPAAPQEGDIRLDDVVLLGETDLGDSVGAAYQVTKSIYGQQNGEIGWVTLEPGLEVIARTHEGEFQKVLGAPNFYTGGLSVEQVIKQVAWRLLDWEVSLWREGHDRPIGIGTEVEYIMEPSDGDGAVQVLGEDYAAPIYQPGDYYAIHGWDLLVANGYHSAAEGTYASNHITCYHPDLYTLRGIHVGSSREDVKAAYPEARDDPYWDWEGDYLWYQPRESEFGPAILFLFQLRGEVSEEVQAVVLVNMVD